MIIIFVACMENFISLPIQNAASEDSDQTVNVQADSDVATPTCLYSSLNTQKGKKMQCTLILFFAIITQQAVFINLKRVVIRVAVGSITICNRFIKNGSWEMKSCY